MDGQVFREVEWTQGGETLRCVPSLLMLKRMKMAGVNVILAAKSTLDGTADGLDLAACHSIMATTADPENPTSQEESYGFLTSGEQADVTSWQMAFVGAVLPSVELGKKPVAPAAPKKPKKKTPARK